MTTNTAVMSKKLERAVANAEAKVEVRKNPGSILADLEILLRFIGPDGIEASGRRHYLPLRLLPDINDQMTQPLDIDLKRPLQKSYPHINGLYYLSRMTGMVHIDQSANIPKLVIDRRINNSWRKLNLTERYFTLLETWVVRGHTEIAGEVHGTSRSPFLDSSYFLKNVGKKKIKVKVIKSVGKAPEQYRDWDYE